MSLNDIPNSPITATVDFAGEGVQHGVLRLPYSSDAAAWSSIVIPVAVIANGSGPTAVLFGGNHGDEYEGPIALYDLARTLNPSMIQGRVIIVPALNWPAFCAGTRTSPIDGVNLNRAFPGDPRGSPTAKIADYVARYLLPLADIVLDFHSGGRTLDFIPYAATHEVPDSAQLAASIDAVTAFGAPWSMVMRELDAVGMLDTTAEALGKTFVTTELGGAGMARVETVAIAGNGVRNVLRHAGILHDRPVEHATPTSWLAMPPDKDCFHLAEYEGLIEPCVDLGGRVREGDLLARIYPIGRTNMAPIDCVATMDGMLVARHVPGLIHAGNCLAVIAIEKNLA